MAVYAVGGVGRRPRARTLGRAVLAPPGRPIHGPSWPWRIAPALWAGVPVATRSCFLEEPASAGFWRSFARLHGFGLKPVETGPP